MKQLLNEYKLNDIWNKEFKDIDYDEFKRIAQIDKISSDINNDDIGEFGVWLARLYKQKKIKLNELISYKEELNEYFKDFNELKRRNKISNPDHKNIFKYKSIDDFFDTIDYYKNNIVDNKEINKKEYTVFYEDSEWIVIIPWTKKASNYFGRNTDWCTSKKEKKYNGYYKYVDHDYDTENVLFYNINKVTKEKYAFYFGYKKKAEFKNKKNKDINPLEIGLPLELIKKYQSEYPNNNTIKWLLYYSKKYVIDDFIFYENDKIKLIYTKDKTFKYINKKNPDDKDFNPNVLDDKLRTAYFNLLKKHDIFKFVEYFGKYGKNVGVAETYDDKYFFINKQGNLANANDIDLDKINNKWYRAGYFNTLKKRNIFKEVYGFGKYGKNVGVAETYDDKHFFINKQGNLADVNDIDLDKIDDVWYRAGYFNLLKKHDIFKEVYKFDVYGENIAFAITIDDKEIFINKQGNLADVNDIDFDKIDSEYYRAAYFNTLKKRHIFKEVYKFGVYGKNVAVAETTNGKYIFINKHGKLADVNDIDLDKIVSEYYRAAYFNILKKRSIFEKFYNFGEHGKNVAFAKIINNIYLYINKQGNLADVNDIDLDKIDDVWYRAGYFNTLKKRYIFKYVYDFGKYDKNVAFANTIDNKSVFINKQGNPDITEINYDKLNYYAIIVYKQTLKMLNK